MTTRASKAVAMRGLALTLRSVRTIKAFKQKSAIPDDDPSSDGYVPLPYKKQRGRPPSQETLQRRALITTLANRPKYVADGIYLPNQMFVRDGQSNKDGMYVKGCLSATSVALLGEGHIFEGVRRTYGFGKDEPIPIGFVNDVLLAIDLFNVGSVANIRKNLGLDHITVPHALIMDLLALAEGPDTDWEARHPGALTFAEREARTMTELDDVKRDITRNAKKSGQEVSPRTQQSLIEKKAPEILAQLETGAISCREAQKLLDAKKLPIPAERSLRRMVQKKRGQEPAPK